MGKHSGLLTAGREWDGEAVSHLVDGTGRESTICLSDGIMERAGNRAGNRSDTKLGNRSGT